MYAAFARLNYTAWYAMAEFVDNSIQSYISNRSKLKRADGPSYELMIDIDIGTDFIKISDNAAGIHGSDFERAFRPAAPPPATNGLSEFGLGMKAAASWFAKKWVVTSTALGEDVQRIISFDIPKIADEGVTRLEVTRKPEVATRHYTEIHLSELNYQPKTQTIGKIKRHLASIYRRFLADGDVSIRVDSEQLSYEDPQILVAPHYAKGGKNLTWRKEVSFKLNGDFSVTGWAGLLDKGSAANAGFALFRRRRLIQGSVGEAYRPEGIFGKSNSFAYQRLIGEFDIEGFGVTHTKDGIQWYDLEDDLLLRLKRDLDREPMPLLKQAQHFRKRENPPGTSMDAAVYDVSESAAQHLPPVIETQIEREPDPSPPPKKLPAAQDLTSAESTMELEHSGRKWNVSVELRAGADNDPWIWHSRDPKRASDKIQIRVNTQFPFQRRFSSPDGSELIPFTRFAVALVVAEVTARLSGVDDAGVVRTNFDELLRALSGPITQGDDDE